MFFLDHPDAINHLAILEHTEKSLLLLEQYSLAFHPFSLFVCSCSSLCPHLVIGDLFQVKMAAVDHLHACVAVVRAAESTPVFRVWIEFVSLLPAALQRNHQWLYWMCLEWATCLPQDLATKPCVTSAVLVLPWCESGCILICQWLIMRLDD